ncbi:WD40 repeat-like protein [Pyrenochaeta sp. DS3sAY3a]|nr:WD40 repeat-like protein [Pyrenochaeta sp. DS3sAY3a]
MRLLYRNDDGLITLKNTIEDEAELPPYSILSHTWFEDEAEVTFQDIKKGTGRSKRGYQKLEFCANQTSQDELQYFWVDTCCINKHNTAELSFAIRSMFRWYKNAARCYVYLSDVDSSSNNDWESDFRKSKWFTRGWTLQELLAPDIVEFFSVDGQKLGDKTSLVQQIHESTGITRSALQGISLSKFTVTERLRWREYRQTTLPEDGAYCLFGILDVDLAPVYGEGTEQAWKRLYKEVDEQERCIQDVRSTDPRYDKRRIEDSKGGLLKDVYFWIFANASFMEWLEGTHKSRLLWIKGDPGKGKTMLLCGIIDELQRTNRNALIAYFFCQATDPQLNTATSVLRGLLYLLVAQRPGLVSHIRKKYNRTSRSLFEDANAWTVLTDIFTEILRDPASGITYLFVDGLDECVSDLSKLLSFIVDCSCMMGSSRVRWIFTSRNWPEIEEELVPANDKLILSLELNADSISSAVNVFIQQKVSYLAQRKKYDDKTKAAVLYHLATNSNDTFLWVALVCQSLEAVSKWNVLKKIQVNSFPPGLGALYLRMMHQIASGDDAELCKRLLASIALVYRPITIQEAAVVVDQLQDLSDDLESLRKIVELCGSFLILRDDVIYFVHQSARDFLLSSVGEEVFLPSKEDAHHSIFMQSCQNLSQVLKRDVYDLQRPSYPIEDIRIPNPDPLAGSKYSCVFWVDHLHDALLVSWTGYERDLQDGGTVDVFLRTKFLYWLESLSLCRSIHSSIDSLEKLASMLDQMAHIQTRTTQIRSLVNRALRFTMAHNRMIELYPIQTYVSAILFSPKNSKELVAHEGIEGITIQRIQDDWSACIQTLEGHHKEVLSVAFSRDSALIASGAADSTARIWDARNGTCLHTLEGHIRDVVSVTFSHDSTRLATASNAFIYIWDTRSGLCLQEFERPNSEITSVTFSHDSALLASAEKVKFDAHIRIWGAHDWTCLLNPNTSEVGSLAFSHDSRLLASGGSDGRVIIWDVKTGMGLHHFEENFPIFGVSFSHDSNHLVSTCMSNIKIWNVSDGTSVKSLQGHKANVMSAVFSHKSAFIVSGSTDTTIKIWDASTGTCVRTLEGHSHGVNSVAYSHTSNRLASSSDDATIKIWNLDGVEKPDSTPKSAVKHDNAVDKLALSHDLRLLASASSDETVKIWNVENGECLRTLTMMSIPEDIAFSPTSILLAITASNATTIYDTRTWTRHQTFQEPHDGGIHRVLTFSPDETRLARSSSYNVVSSLWDLTKEILYPSIDRKNKGRIWSVAFSHDSDLLIRMTNSGWITIIDARTGTRLKYIKSDVDFQCALCFGNTWCYLSYRNKIFRFESSLRREPEGSSNLQLCYSTPPPAKIRFGNTSKCLLYEDKKILLLPAEYRPWCWVVSGALVAVGTKVGRVWICKIEPDKLPKYMILEDAGDDGEEKTPSSSLWWWHSASNPGFSHVD